MVPTAAASVVTGTTVSLVTSSAASRLQPAIETSRRHGE
jgi:hypothetical protein